MEYGPLTPAVLHVHVSIYYTVHIHKYTPGLISSFYHWGEPRNKATYILIHLYFRMYFERREGEID